MTEGGYPAARAAALRIQPHFIHHLTGGTDEADRGNLVPDLEAAEAIVSAAFWASLRREEAWTPRVSLAFITPEHVEGALKFERPILLESLALTRLAPAVERPGIHLGVRREEGALWIWGALRQLPASCFVLEVIAPGHLVIKQSRGEESGKFINVAVLEGERIKIIDQQAATEPDCPALLKSLLGLDSQFAPVDSVNVLIRMAASMRAHGRGGSLLVVPAGTREWEESILKPITYSVMPAYSALADLMQEDAREKRRLRWQGAVGNVLEGIAGLTAVDGATLIDDGYQVLAFGVKIIRPLGSHQVQQVIVTEPIEGSTGTVEEPSQLGGTRHLSAAQFAHDQRNGIALVASQDGRFTVFGWSPREDMVHAHRIEALLL
jgi:hypothetical protein